MLICFFKPEKGNDAILIYFLDILLFEIWNQGPEITTEIKSSSFCSLHLTKAKATTSLVWTSIILLILFFYFLILWHQVAFIILFTSQLTVLNNYLCALDTTLRILITWYKLHVMNYISFLGVIVLAWIFSPSFNPGVVMSGCWHWPFISISDDEPLFQP